MSGESNQQLMDLANRALDVGDYAAAERFALRVLRGIGEPAGDDALLSAVEAEMLMVEVDTELGRDESAMRRLARVEELAPGDAEAAFLAGRLRLVRWEFTAAEECFLRCEAPDELRGELLYHRAIVADMQGRNADADRLYAEAAAIDPAACPLPVRISDDAAQQMLTDLVASFPNEVTRVLDNVQIEIVDVPDVVIDRSPETDPLVLGLYHGVPITERSSTAIALPDRVRIFKRNIERVAADRDKLLEELRITLLHEVGHHLGWDEDDLEERGLA